MILAVNWLAIAHAETDEAIRWYEERHAGLGLESLLEVAAVVERATDSRECTRSSIETFGRRSCRDSPYVLMYRVMNAAILVVAVFHAVRIPSDWQARLTTD